MKNYHDMSDELETLKAQMAVLTNTLKEKEILTEDMILSTTKMRIKPFVPSKRWIYISFVLIFVMLALFIFAHAVDGEFSTTFIGITFFYFAYIIYKGYQYLKLDLNDTLMNGSLTEVTEKVAVMKKMNSTHALITALVVAIWAGSFLFETWQDLTTNLDHAVFVFVIFTFVGSTVIGKFYRTNKVTKEVLARIEELKK